MRVSPDVPVGLAGVSPRPSVGVRVKTGRRGPGGAPVDTDRFWMVSPQSASAEFSAGGRTFRGLKSEPHPGFKKWNDLAEKGPGRVSTLRGNMVHSNWRHAFTFNRSAQKLPEPHPNPPSQRPACQGDGVRAIRYEGLADGRENFVGIACPNELCQFAMNGTCKPFAALLFRLRWADDDPNFLPMLALWSTRGWNSLRNILGLFEQILGTEEVAPWEPRESWRPGLAAELGIEHPSVLGLPFTMTVGQKTKPSERQRFTVVSFSLDGDPVGWLASQRKLRELIGGTGEPRSLPPAPAIVDREVEGLLNTERLDLDPSALDLVISGTPAASAPTDAPPLLSAAKVSRLLEMATKAEVPVESLQREAARLAGTGDLAGVPSIFETDLIGYIQRTSPRRRR